MNPVVSHLVSGRALFTGLGLMVGLALVIEFTTRPALRRWLSAEVGLLGLLALSTAALPVVCIGLSGLVFIVWAFRSYWARSVAQLRLGTDLLIAGSLGLMLYELPWTRMSSGPVAEARSLVVIGDSISAGLGEGEGTPWPSQFREMTGLSVWNLSEAGATTQDGIASAKLALQFPGLVLIELGGNDLLGSRSINEFERDLTQMLQTLEDQDRHVVMVELPLLPSKNEWGVVLRRLSRRFRVPLIPKRVLVDVLSAPGSTVDTLHLSQAGHRRMAEAVWNQLEIRWPPP